MGEALYSQRWIRVACWLVFLVALLANLFVWNHPKGSELGNGHAFRQYQTAFTTRYLIRDGFAVDYEMPVFGPPWSLPMEFPLYQYAVAATVRLTGTPLEQAGRFVSMGFFWAALPALWLLLGLWRIAREGRLLATALFLVCPVYLFYGRHFMIETTALCLGLWFLWAFVRTLRTSSVILGLLALVLGIAASLAKITTFFGFGLAAALVLADEIRQRRQPWLQLLGCAALVMLPTLALTLLWVHHSDELKAKNPIGDFLVSSRLHDFNFGPPSQRFHWETWYKFYEVTRARIASDILLVLAMVGVALTDRSRRWLAGASLLCFLGPLAVLTNLFFVHDYYFEATAVFLIIAAALSLEGLLNHRSLPAALRGLFLLLILFSQLTSFWREFGGQFTSPPAGPPLVAPLIKRVTEPEDVIAVVGQDWNAWLLYHCDRRGLMVRSGFEQNRSALRQSLSLLGSRRIGALVVSGSFREHPEVIIPLARMMGLAPRPLAEGDGMLVYLPLDRLEKLPALLSGAEYPGFKIRRDYDPAKDLLNAETQTDFNQPVWQGKFPMTSPAPQYMTGLFVLSFAEVEGTQVIATHAPNSIYFQPPPGARRLRATGGMFPGAYTGANHTDGVVIEAWESLPDGNQQQLYRRVLLPHEHLEDRAEFVIDIKKDRPFLGSVHLRVDPGPAEQINYDWVYWRSVKID